MEYRKTPSTPTALAPPTPSPIDEAAIRGVIFDCDGVMFDTEQANRAYYNQILRHLNHAEMSPEQFAYCQMHTVDQSIAHLFPKAADLAVAQAYRRQMSYLPFIPLMQMEPDLKPLLAGLRPERFCAIATNRTDTMQRVLEDHGLARDFDMVVSALDVPRPKPHPDQLEKIMDHFGIKAGEVIYIGDSSVDMLAARAVGMPFISFRNHQLQAACHVGSFTQVGALLGVSPGSVA